MSTESVGEHWLSIIHRFNQFYMPFVIAVGLVGNLLSVLVFLNTKLRHIPSSHYLTALAIADSGMLLAQLFSMLAVDLTVKPGWCLAIIYLHYVFSFLSVWYVVCFTIERYIVVCYPLKRLIWCTIRRARTVIYSVSVIPCVFNSYLLVLLRDQSRANGTACYYPDEWFLVANIFNLIDTGLTLVLPTVIIISLNLRIVKTVLRSHHAMGRVPAFRVQTRASSSRKNSSVRGSRRKGVVATLSKRISASNNAKEEKITRMLLIVSFVFLTMNLPDHLMRILELVLKQTHKWETLERNTKLNIHIAHLITNVIFLSSFSINFFLYNIVGVNFRLYLKNMILGVAAKITGTRRTESTTHLSCAARSEIATKNRKASNIELIERER